MERERIAVDIELSSPHTDTILEAEVDKRIQALMAKHRHIVEVTEAKDAVITNDGRLHLIDSTNRSDLGLDSCYLPASRVKYREIVFEDLWYR